MKNDDDEMDNTLKGDDDEMEDICCEYCEAVASILKDGIWLCGQCSAEEAPMGLEDEEWEDWE